MKLTLPSFLVNSLVTTFWQAIETNTEEEKEPKNVSKGKRIKKSLQKLPKHKKNGNKSSMSENVEKKTQG